jgi:PAS domain-containing protein
VIDQVPDPAALWHAIFEASPMALQLYARDGRSLFVNPAHTAMFGAVPPPEYNLFADSLLEQSGVAALVMRAFAGERISTPPIWYDIRLLENLPTTMDRSRARRRAISSEMVPIRDAQGEFAYVLIVFNDHTASEQRAAQATFLAEATRLLGESLDLDRTLA